MSDHVGREVSPVWIHVEGGVCGEGGEVFWLRFTSRQQGNVAFYSPPSFSGTSSHQIFICWRTCFLCIQVSGGRWKNVYFSCWNHNCRWATVDGSEIPRPTNWNVLKPSVNNGSLLVSRISEPSTVVTFSGSCQKSNHQMLKKTPLETRGSPPERVPTVGAAAGSAKGTTSKRIFKVAEPYFQIQKFELVNHCQGRKWIKMDQNWCFNMFSPKFQGVQDKHLMFSISFHIHWILGAAEPEMQRP